MVVQLEVEADLPAEDSTVVRHPLEPPRASLGPVRALVTEDSETFEDIGIATLMMISSSSAVFLIRSFIPTTATTLIRTAIPMGITRAMDTILIINPVTAALRAVYRFGKSKSVWRAPAFTTDGLTE
jgi:hypothetical protein